MRNTNLLFAVLLMVFIGITFANNPVDVSVVVFILDSDGTLTPATSARPGQVVVYQVDIYNSSNMTLPPGAVVITGPAPTGTELIYGSAVQHPGFEVNEYPDRVEWVNTVTLEAGASAQLEYHVRILGDAPTESTRSGIAEYRAELPEGCTGVATISTRDGTEQHTVRNGWTRRMNAAPGQFLYISVQNQCDHGTVRVFIYRDGNRYRTASSSGAYVIATVSGPF